MRRSSGVLVGFDPNLVELVVDATTARTFALSDAAKAILFTNASAIAATVPPNSSVAYPVGTLLQPIQAGAGALSVVAGSGVTIFGPGLKAAGTGSSLLLLKTATNEWYIFGDLALPSDYSMLAWRMGYLDATLTTTGTQLGPSVNRTIGSTAAGEVMLPISSALWPPGNLTNFLRLEVAYAVNDTAPATSITVELYPLATVAGGAAALTITLGTVVSGSGATVTTPAANAKGVVLGSDFAIPADGLYVVKATPGATIPTNSRTFIGAKVLRRAA